jgi:hypothetical protein
MLVREARALGIDRTEACKEYVAGPLKAGFTLPEIEVMARRNPARLIGLE